MPTQVSVSRPEIFPKGQVVKLFAIPSPPPAELAQQTGDPSTWPKPLVEVNAGSTVAASGTVTWSAGISPGGQYLAYASVSGQDRYLRVMAPSNQGGAGANAEPFSEWGSGTAKTVRAPFTAPAGKRAVITEITATIISIGAVAASTAIDVNVKVKGNTTRIGMLQSPKTTGEGEGKDSVSLPVNLPSSLGEEVAAEAVAPTNARIALTISGYVE